VLEQIALAWQSLVYTFRELFRGTLWIPWLLLGAIELAVVAALWWFAHPALSWLMAPIVALVAGSSALHYPAFFRELPGIFSRIDLAIVALVGSLAIGASTALFAARFAGRTAPPGSGFAVALRRALPLILVNLPLNLLVVGIPFALESWVATRGSSGLVVKAAQILGLCGAWLAQALFIYGTALVVLSGRGVVGAFASLPGAATRGLWAALTLGIVTWLPVLPMQLLTRKVAPIFDRGRPELVTALVVAQIVLALVTSFVLTGGITLVYQTAVAGHEGDRR